MNLKKIRLQALDLGFYCCELFSADLFLAFLFLFLEFSLQNSVGQLAHPRQIPVRYVPSPVRFVHSNKRCLPCFGLLCFVTSCIWHSRSSLEAVGEIRPLLYKGQRSCLQCP